MGLFSREVTSEKEGLLSKIKRGLQKTREHFSASLDKIFKGKKSIDEELFDELEELLVTSDVSIDATTSLLKKLKERVKKEHLQEPSSLYKILGEEIASIVNVESEPFNPKKGNPTVIMVIGVNGVGKTTTIAKLGHLLKKEGLKPLLVAADTFRAAAIDQLSLWAEKTQLPVIKQKPGADPSAVVFDALEAAISRKHDVVIIDTAGRMHTKSNLMEELKKIKRVIAKKIPDAPHETLLVLDATTGQNAISQVKVFKEAIEITGLILTKLDGTAKGGSLIGICHDFKIPVRFVGIGEGVEDLRPFDPLLFSRALLELED